MPSVFLSYSHKDEVWKDRLTVHLGVLKTQGLLDIWDDRQIDVRADWFEGLQEAMASARIAILLISADFLTSKFIRGNEVPRMLTRRAKEGLHVIPVLVRSCEWKEVPWLAQFQDHQIDSNSLVSLEDQYGVVLSRIATEVLSLIPASDSGGEERRDDFLDRIEAIFRLRDPEAEIRRLPGSGTAGAYLRVVRQYGDLQDSYPVGAIEHDLTWNFFQAFLEEIDAPYRRNDSGLISCLVYGGAPAPADLVAEAGTHRVRLMSFVEHQGLIDFRTYLSRQTRKLAHDPIYPSNLYVSQRMQILSILGREEKKTNDALGQIQEWLDAPFGRFIVLLGDFGTGKTFLLHELARRMGEVKEGLVPILLQMRSLEKGRSLDELLAQHFAREGMEGFSLGKFRYMLEQGRIALLFDGFDELALRVTYAKAADHFSTLLQAAAGNAKVVLTSRRQHFLSESQVKTALAQQLESLSGHRLAILQPFGREQVHLFLHKFFEGSEERASARLDLIDRVKDLLGLSSNPRLLGFIADLPEEQLIAACSDGGQITAAKLYELLLDRWLTHEFDRVHPVGAPPGLSVTERWQAVTLLAIRLWQKAGRFVSLSDLSEEAARVVQAVGPSALDTDVIAFQVGSGTLLVRDEEGNFAFLHHSILEWLVARSAAEDLASGLDSEALFSRDISPLMADFLVSLAGRERVVAWARGVLSAPAGETAQKNALLILERQKEVHYETLDLTGKDLRAHDYSGQDLSGANLSHADLTEARLIGTILSNARLVKTALRSADLSRSTLTEADFTDADLTSASMLGANLRRARLSRSRLRRTKLLRTSLEGASLDEAEVFGTSLDLDELSPQGSVTWECVDIDWSPDGELMASGDGSVIRIREAQNGREIRAFTGHKHEVRSVTFSPDGRTLASASDDKTIRIWQVDSGREIRVLKGHESGVKSVAFSPDGKSLASGSDDKSVRIWHVDSGQEVRALKGHESGVKSVAFSPDGKSLASGSDDKFVRIWQVDSGQEVRALKGHENGVKSVAFSPDGKSLASASDDRSIRIWQVDSGQEVGILKGHRKEIRCVTFSPDGKMLASSSDDKTIRLWQVDNGREIRIFEGHKKGVWSVAFNPDGQRLASGSYDKTVRIWQVNSGREIRVLAGHQNEIWSVSFSSDGKSIVSGSSDKIIRLWQIDSGREVKVVTGHQSGILSTVFSPKSTSLASGSLDSTVRLWQVDGGHEIRTLRGHQNAVSSVAFSPDGNCLASGSDDKIVRLWQVEDGRELRSLIGHEKSVTSLAFSPDGERLASGSLDNTIRLWQLNGTHEIKAINGHQNGVFSVAFSPDGTRLISGSEDKTIRLWHLDSGHEVRAFTGHQGGVLSVAFSPDGKNLVSGSDDKTVRLWQVDDGREIRILTGHQNGVFSVAFNPDGKSLVSGSSDGTIRLWNMTDGRCLAVLLPLPEGWVAYSPDGRYKFGGVPAGGFWHTASLCRFEIGELDEWVPGLHLADDASFFDLPPWKPEVVVPERF